MKKIPVTAVSYLNTFPFVYGLQKSAQANLFDLTIAVPSLCTERLASGEATIALIPVGSLPDFNEIHILTDYCIGASGQVRTVLLLSEVPLPQITSIGLDLDSRTSVQLVRILAHRYWKINPQFHNLPTAVSQAGRVPSLVAIGDKTFGLSGQYPYVYDLAEEWIRFTGLPFVFAVWAAIRKPSADTTDALASALRFGMDRKKECLQYFQDRLPDCGNCLNYLEQNISYELDSAKRSGMELFLRMMQQGNE